jgi:1,4-alpha-glucan branching enzyme
VTDVASDNTEGSDMVTQKGDGTLEFRFFRPNARRVVLTGDFNNWSQSGPPMTRQTDGIWRSRLHLAPGVYQFRYLADGQWYVDHAAFGIQQGPFGPNAVVKVDS